jgi:prepilin-type N-terminal cleavage/methylation domain-containing protein
MPSAIRKGRFGGRAGFTLFEVIVVLLILGVLSYFAATRLFTEQNISQFSEIDLVKNHLRYAQSRAMNTERNWGLVFEIQATGAVPPSKYWLYYEDESANKIRVRLPGDDTSPETGTEARKFQLKALHISSVSNSLYSNEVRFFCGSADKSPSWRGKFGSPSVSNDDADMTINTSAGTIIIRKNTGYIP